MAYNLKALFIEIDKFLVIYVCFCYLKNIFCKNNQFLKFVKRCLFYIYLVEFKVLYIQAWYLKLFLKMINNDFKWFCAFMLCVVSKSPLQYINLSVLFANGKS